MKSGYWIGLLCVTLVSGCPGEMEPPVVAPLAQTSASPEAETLFKQAVGQFESANLEAADEGFSSFLDQFSDDPLCGLVMLYRARIAIAQTRIDDARSILLAVLARGEGEPAADYATMYLGLVAYQVGEFESALDYLVPLSGRFTAQSENLEIARTIWMSFEALHNWKEQLVWIERYIEYGADVPLREEAIQKVQQVVALQSEADLKAVQRQLDGKGVVWTLVGAQIARLQLEGERYDAATDTVTDIRESGEQNTDLIRDLLALIETRNRVEIRRIGCILPLSGKMRVVGNDVQKGVLLAASQHRFGRDGLPLTVLAKDSMAEGKTPEELVEELVLKEHVSAIVGPMDARISKRAVKKAQQLGVPLIALSTDDTLAPAGPYVFRKFASNTKEVAALVQQARHQLAADGQPRGTVRFAVLYPNNAYGKLMLKEFETRVSADHSADDPQVTGGGTNVMSLSFDAGTADFSVVAEELARREFTVLFLPMTAQQLALAAPALAAAGIWPSASGDRFTGKVVTYLIPSAGFSSSLVSRSGRYLQGAFFVADFNLNRPGASLDFVRNFQNEFKSTPSALAAYGYDAMKLISNAIEDGVVNRMELRTWLDEAVSATGTVYPFVGFDEQGEAISLPTVSVLSGTELQ